MIKASLLILSTLFILSGCGDKEESKKSTIGSGMKCGAGKCGASMVDGSSLLAKKKKNILSQMRKDDSRKDCVLKAKNTKKLYDCVRDTKTKKLTMKCGTDKCGKNTQKSSNMKCGVGKCGDSSK